MMLFASQRMLFLQKLSRPKRAPLFQKGCFAVAHQVYIHSMRTRASIALLLPLACLLGCSLPYTPPPLSSNWANWQIQAGTAITSPPTAPYLVGALQGANSALTGTFNMQQAGSGVTPQVVNFTGTYDPTTGNLALTGSPVAGMGIGVMLSVPADPTDVATGTLLFQCGVCANGLSLPAAGVQIAPLNGTYSGTVTGCLGSGNTDDCVGITGTASLVLTQSSTPNASGQFPLTGTITFPSSSNLGTITLSGTVAGEGITLTNPCPCAVSGPMISLTASTNPAATQITISNLNYTGGGTDIHVTFTGTLALQ